MVDKLLGKTVLEVLKAIPDLGEAEINYVEDEDGKNSLRVKAPKRLRLETDEQGTDEISHEVLLNSPLIALNSTLLGNSADVQIAKDGITLSSAYGTVDKPRATATVKIAPRMVLADEPTISLEAENGDVEVKGTKIVLDGIVDLTKATEIRGLPSVDTSKFLTTDGGNQTIESVKTFLHGINIGDSAAIWAGGYYYSLNQEGIEIHDDRDGSGGVTRYINMPLIEDPDTPETLATREWAWKNSIHDTDDITWQGDHEFAGATTFSGDVNFDGKVDFTNATVTGLPSSGGSGGSGELTAEAINSALDGQQLQVGGLGIQSDGITFMAGNINEKHDEDMPYLRVDSGMGGYLDVKPDGAYFNNRKLATVNEVGSGGGLDLGDADISYDSEIQSLNITSPSTVKLHSDEGTTLTVSPDHIYLMSNQDYGSVEVTPTRVWLFSEHSETGSISDIILEDGNITHTADGTHQITCNSGTTLTVSPSSIYLMSSGDFSSINVSPTDVTLFSEHAENGGVSSIELNDGNITYSADNSHIFNGNVDFSNAQVTGLPSGGSVDTSKFLTTDTEQTIDSSKTFSADASLSFQNAGTIYNEGGILTIEGAANSLIHVVASDNHLTIEDLGITFKAGNSKYLQFEVHDINDESSRLLFTGDAAGGSFELNRCDGLGVIRSTNDELRLEHYDVDTETSHWIVADSNGLHLSSDTKIDFNGTVDFANATVTGLPSGGGGCGSGCVDLSQGQASIHYAKGARELVIENNGDIVLESSEYTYLKGNTIVSNASIDDFSCTNRADFIVESNFHGDTTFSGNVNFSEATVTGLPSAEVDTASDFSWEGNHQFHSKAEFLDEVDFSNAIVSGISGTVQRVWFYNRAELFDWLKTNWQKILKVKFTKPFSSEPPAFFGEYHITKNSGGDSSNYLRSITLSTSSNQTISTGVKITRRSCVIDDNNLVESFSELVFDDDGTFYVNEKSENIFTDDMWDEIKMEVEVIYVN